MGDSNYSSSSLISCAELSNELKQPDWVKKIRIIDARCSLAEQDYHGFHIQNRIFGSKFFSFEECCDTTSSYKIMLPSAEVFSNYITRLGISNEHHVVVYDHDEVLNLGALYSPRVWWMFRAFGYEKVSILDGGFGKWISDGYPTVSGPYKDGEQLPESNAFKACDPPKFVVKFENMKNNVESNSPKQIIDTRLKEELVEGCIPNSRFTPFTGFFNEDGTMKGKDDLKAFFEERSVDLNADTLVTCTMGVTAAIAAYAFLQCTGKNVGLYDGSFNEWADKAPNLISLPSTEDDLSK